MCYKTLFKRVVLFFLFVFVTLSFKPSGVFAATCTGWINLDYYVCNCASYDIYENCASTAGRKSSSSLGPQWTARVRPLERLCHRPVEIVDKIEDACAQVF